MIAAYDISHPPVGVTVRGQEGLSVLWSDGLKRACVFVHVFVRSAGFSPYLFKLSGQRYGLKPALRAKTRTFPSQRESVAEFMVVLGKLDACLFTQSQHFRPAKGLSDADRSIMTDHRIGKGRHQLDPGVRAADCEANRRR